MNKIFLTGRTTDNVELKMTTTGIPTVSFTLAVDRKSKANITDFFDIIAFRHQAEFVAKYVSKGRKIALIGELQTRTYDTKDGKKRKAYEVFADEIEFADSKPQEKKEQDPDDELPFAP